MDESKKSVVDDQNDTLLFQRLQEHVIDYYPNPNRIGCLDRETLVSFVESPATLNLEDPKYLHIFQCSECTRDLIDLRLAREARLDAEERQRKIRSVRLWQFAGVAATILAVVGLTFYGYRYRMERSSVETADVRPVSVLVDLSAEGVSRDLVQGHTPSTVSLPARRVNLRLILPFYSPGGNYRVTITRSRSHDAVEAEGTGPAAINGARTELNVTIDLQHVRHGVYFLATEREGDREPYYYPALIR